MRISDWSSDVCSSDLAGAAIFPIEQPAEGLGADHQRAAVDAGAQHRIGDLDRVEEARAHRRDIERDAIVHAEHRLHLGRRRRADRKSVVYGKSVSVRVATGGRGLIKKPTTK